MKTSRLNRRQTGSGGCVNGDCPQASAGTFSTSMTALLCYFGSRISPRTRAGLALVAVVALAATARAEDFAGLCADRTALEHVYYGHRLGQKPPFEQASPPALIAQLVAADLHKEAVLRKVYGVDVTPAMVDAEVRRIDATTRAPEVLAEIKHTLGDDPARFARTMARPIVVERTLRARFENDDALHAAQRAVAAQVRTKLLAAPKVASTADLQRDLTGTQVTETTWQLTPRPAEAAPAAPAAATTPTKASARSGAYSNEATAQIAQVLSPAPANAEQKFYFEDLDPELQKVLLAQLRKPGDVSAVIETPGGFLVFLNHEKTASVLRVTALSFPKRSYEAWLAQQPEDPK